MATQSTSNQQSSARGKSAKTGKETDALELLKADHREVERLISQFEKASGDAKKLDIARKICLELKVHTKLEEELLYPAARENVKDESLVNEAVVEHESAKRLIADIDKMEAGDEMLEAKVTVLGEQVQHHVEEEEKELFPQLKKSGMDLEGLGEKMLQRKEKLQEQFAKKMQ